MCIDYIYNLSIYDKDISQELPSTFPRAFTGGVRFEGHTDRQSRLTFYMSNKSPFSSV